MRRYILEWTVNEPGNVTRYTRPFVEAELSEFIGRCELLRADPNVRAAALYVSRDAGRAWVNIGQWGERALVVTRRVQL